MNLPSPSFRPLPLTDEPPLWRLLLDPRGRIARQTWWLWGVAAPLSAGLLMHLLLAIARVRLETAEHIVNLGLLWPTLAMSIKRWHDRDHSGAWVAIVLIPVLGWAVALWCNGVLKGTAGTNRFGPDPRAAP